MIFWLGWSPALRGTVKFDRHPHVMQVLKDWFNGRWRPQLPALSQMRLCSPESNQNALMVRQVALYSQNADDSVEKMQFFTWDSRLEDMSLWKHLETESATLSSRFGVSQVWLPPPSKAAKPSGQGYDAYDLVRLLLSVFSGALLFDTI